MAAASMELENTGSGIEFFHCVDQIIELNRERMRKSSVASPYHQELVELDSIQRNNTHKEKSMEISYTLPSSVPVFLVCDVLKPMT